MKTTWASLLMLVFFTSCTTYIVEPAYDDRDRVIGYYDMEEYSSTYSGYTYYGVTISKATNSNNRILISNFYAADLLITAYLDGDRITIPEQTINGYRIEGSGSYHRDELHLIYKVKDRLNNTYTDFCDTYAYRNW